MTQPPTLPGTHPVTVEVDTGSATTWDRPPELAWLVRLRRADRSVIVAVGLSHTAAHHLAERITELVQTPDPAPATNDRPHQPRPNEPTISIDQHHAEIAAAALQVLEDWMLTCSQETASRLDHDHGTNTFALTWARILHHRCQLQRALALDDQPPRTDPSKIGIP